MADPDHLINPDSLNGDDLATTGLFTAPVSTEGRDHLLHPDSLRGDDFMVGDDFTVSLTTLVDDGISQTQDFAEITLTPKSLLQTDSVAQTNELSVPSLTQHGGLVINSLAQSVTANELSLEQHNALSPDGLEQTVELEGDIGLQQNYLLSVDSMGQIQQVERGFLEQVGALTVYDPNQSQTTNEIQITQSHLLGVENITQSQQSQSANLAATFNLTPHLIEQISRLSSASFAIVLEAQNSGQSQTVDEVLVDTSGYLFPNISDQSQLFGQSFFTGLYISYLIGEVVMYNTLEAKPYMGPLYTG